GVRACRASAAQRLSLTGTGNLNRTRNRESTGHEQDIEARALSERHRGPIPAPAPALLNAVASGPRLGMKVCLPSVRGVAPSDVAFESLQPRLCQLQTVNSQVADLLGRAHRILDSSVPRWERPVTPHGSGLMGIRRS